MEGWGGEPGKKGSKRLERIHGATAGTLIAKNKPQDPGRRVGTGKNRRTC